MSIEKTLLERYSQAKTRKDKYNHTLEEIGKYVWPDAKDMIKTVNVEGEGQVHTVNIYNSTANTAAYRMTSGIFSYLMPVGTKWFEFVAQDKQLNKDTIVKNWLSTATDATHQEIWRSNFQREMFTAVRSLVVFGTGVISVERNKKELVFHCYHLGDLFFEENSKGFIDTVFRKIVYTARQARQEFGDNLGKTVEAELSKDPDSNKKFEFIHCVFPNSDYDRYKIGSKKYASVYLNKEDKVVVKKGGFNAMPYLVARFAKSPGEVLGRSPSHEMLPEIKMLDAMSKTFIESSQLSANPPMWMEDDSVVGQPVISPGAMNYIRHGSRDPFVLNTGINAQLNAELLDRQEMKLQRAYFNDLFDVLANYRNMTATEVQARVEEKMVLLSPAISALQKELFDPLITRVLDLLVEGEVVPKPGFEFDRDIVYQGRLALAMSTMQANAIEATMAKWAVYNELHPIFDNLDIDAGFRQSALSMGVPADLLVDEDQVTEQRAERQQKQEMAEQAEIADTAANAYNKVTKAAEPGSLAGSLM